MITKASKSFLEVTIGLQGLRIRLKLSFVLALRGVIVARRATINFN